MVDTTNSTVENVDVLKSVVAQLRHAYHQILLGVVGDPKDFADGLIAPAIRHLENMCAKYENGGCNNQNSGLTFVAQEWVQPPRPQPNSVNLFKEGLKSLGTLCGDYDSER